MYKTVLLCCLLLFIGCKEKPVQLTAQQIVDQSILACGGDLYENTNRSFVFREIQYKIEQSEIGPILSRIITTDSSKIVDTRTTKGFTRKVNDSLVVLADTTALNYSNSVNSVHYFANLPFGLNDAAVTKELLPDVVLNNVEYYTLKVTFGEQGGGDDFDDVYVYWINKSTFLPDFLAYEYQTNGGGMRFREAYNLRYVNGIRFVDYNNYKPEDGQNTSIYTIDELFETDKLILLSKIELTDITVLKHNYN